MTIPVYWWPPVGLTAWELTLDRPVSRSVGVIDGRPRTSSASRDRHLVTANVTGMGRDQAGAGYIEMLKEILPAGGLVRMRAQSAIWHVARTGFRNERIFGIPTGGGSMLFTATGGADLILSTSGIWGTPTTVDGFNAVALHGFPPGVIVIRPHEMIWRIDSAGVKSLTTPRRALRVVRSDSNGDAVVPFLGDAWPAEGLASLGDDVEMVLEPLSMPRAVQPATGTWGYQWDFREVFADEFASGFQTYDPWGVA